MVNKLLMQVDFDRDGIGCKEDLLLMYKDLCIAQLNPNVGKYIVRFPLMMPKELYWVPCTGGECTYHPNGRPMSSNKFANTNLELFACWVRSRASYKTFIFKEHWFFTSLEREILMCRCASVKDDYWIKGVNETSLSFGFIFDNLVNGDKRICVGNHSYWVPKVGLLFDSKLGAGCSNKTCEREYSFT